MDILENKQMIMKNRCKTLGKITRILFWLYLILSIGVLLYLGIRALAAPESAFLTEQHGSDAMVGFQIGDRGFYLGVTDTSFHIRDFSCKVLFGIVWLIGSGYQVLAAAILWCLASIFHRINLDESPFTLSCSHLVRCIGFLLLGVFVYKNGIEAAVLFIFGPPTARLALISSPGSAFVGGIVICLSYIFEYGVVLQQQSDETL